MRINVASLTMFVAGAVLIYSAVRDVNPIDLLKATLQGKELPKPKSGFDPDADVGGGSGGGGGGSW